MRRVLEWFYSASGAVAAGFLCLILITVLAQVALNVADRVWEVLTGAPVGLLIPSYADFAGYFLACATFFALAYSLRRGAHIRVNLVLLRFSERWRQAAEIWCAGLAAAFTLFFLWYAVNLAHDSWRFGDVSTGLVAIPIWLPQTAMCFGIAALAVATLDSFLTALMGGTPPYAEQEADLEQVMER